MSRDQVAQWFCLEKTRAEQSRQSLRLEQVRHLARRKHARERFVIGRPRNANGAISAPALAPVTIVNCGRVPRADQPASRPAPNAASAPPPDSASTTGCFAETRDTTERRTLETAGSSAQMRASGMPGTTATACS